MSAKDNDQQAKPETQDSAADEASVDKTARADHQQSESAADEAPVDNPARTEQQKSGAAADEASASSNRRYSSEEVGEIIRLSLQHRERETENSVDYDELLAIASEVGVGAEEVDRAAEMLEAEQQARDKADNLWARFRSHSIVFICVNLFCIGLNVMTITDVFWSMYLLFGWGLFLLGHYGGLRYAPQLIELAMQRTSSLASAKFQEFFDENANVGFTVGDPMGLTETRGLISLEDNKVLVEYQTLDSMVGLLKTRIKSVEIELANLTEAKLEQKLWSADLVLQGRNMRAFSNAPGSDGDRLRLKINRQSRKAAEGLAQEIRARLAA